MSMVLAVFFLLSATAAAGSIALFLPFRFMGGLAIGGVSVLSPMYISEIAPPASRGRLAVPFQLAIVIGILVAFFYDYLLIGTEPNNWRWMFLAGAAPALVFPGMLFFVSESPRWLVKTGKMADAERVIDIVNPGEDIKKTMDEIRQSMHTEMVFKGINLFRKPYLRPELIGNAEGMFNQFTGINVIMYYTTNISGRQDFPPERLLHKQ